MTARTNNTGLLLAMMEPSPILEEEFQDWYDAEHFPERDAIDGFLTARRLVCIDGWPRYLAAYDLESVEVLKGGGYGKIAGENYSTWTKRIVPRVWGHYRAEATQIYPGNLLFGASGRMSRTVIWRFRNVPDSEETAVVDGLRAFYDERAETAQLRVFRTTRADIADYIASVELHVPLAPEPGASHRLGPVLRHVDLVNTYTTYNRA